jgi:hypothetical protein
MYTLFAEGAAMSTEAAQSMRVPGLRQGWLLGRQMDLSDTQWRDFRGSLHILAPVMKVFVVLSLLVGARQLAGGRADFGPRHPQPAAAAGAKPGMDDGRRIGGRLSHRLAVAAGAQADALPAGALLHRLLAGVFGWVAGLAG